MVPASSRRDQAGTGGAECRRADWALTPEEIAEVDKLTAK